MENFVGKVLGNRYEVRNEIGSGGMAVVYKAFDTIEQREVAIKILKDEHMASDEYRKRFRDESRSLSLLNHPNIVKVYDVSFGETLQYIVMEYINGITLKEYIGKAGAISWKYALYFATQILRALQHAHDKGIIHRDIKPQNIMVLSTGDIKVTDFGIAKFSRADTNTMTQNGVAIGSAHYISPEQARGEKTDARADIYSVGIVLYEMLTGQLPFRSDSLVSVALMQVQEEPKRPRELNSGIPRGLEQITLRAMQKSTRDRYQTAAEMLLDLDQMKSDPNTLFDYPLNTVPVAYTARRTNQQTAPATENTQTVATQTPNYNVESSNAVSRGGEYNQQTRQQTPYVRKNASGNLPGIESYSNDDSGYADVKSGGSVTIPILVIVLVLLLGAVGFVSYKIYDNYFNVEKIEVPQFIGQSYEDVIAQYSDQFNFEAEPEYVYNSEYDEGIVCNQSVKAGEKIKSGKAICLSVASGGEKKEVPDVTGMSFTEASAILKSYGFSVKSTPVTDSDKEEGYVTKSEPAAGEMATYRDTIILYVVTHGDTIKVPTVVGVDKDSAKKQLEDLGLTVVIKTGGSDAEQKDLVIEQSITPDTEVAVNTEITITVGTGVPDIVKGSISVSLPDDEDLSAKVICYVGDEITSQVSTKLDGSSVVLDVQGTGDDNALKIYIDDFLYIEGNVDFSGTEPSFEIKTRNTYQSKATTVAETEEPTETETDTPSLEDGKVEVPSVSGMTLSAAQNALDAAGFGVSVKYEENDDYSPGTVISQSITGEADEGVTITLTVAKAQSVVDE